jgi:hypothetical protein
MGGREPTKTRLIPRRMRKRMGEMRRRVLVLRKVSFQKEYTIQLYRINYSFSTL